MAEMWYYTTEGKQMDPVSIRELKQLVGDGTLKPTDMVWKEGMPRWIRASSVKELFPDPTSALDKYFPNAAPVPRPAAAGLPPMATGALTPIPKSTPPAADEPQQKRRPGTKDADEEGRSPRRRPEPQSGGGSNIVIIVGLLAGAFVLLTALFGGVVILIFMFKPNADPKIPVVDGGPKGKPARLVDREVKFDAQLKPNERKDDSFTFRQGTAYDLSAIYQPKDPIASLQLNVIHVSGKIVAGPDRFLKWTPADDGDYKVQVVNNGARDLKASVTIKPWKDEPLEKDLFAGKGNSKSLKMSRNEVTVMRIRVREDYPVSINVTTVSPGPGSNFQLTVSKDNDPNNIIKSETGKNPSVRFDAPATEILRVQIKNVGKTPHAVSIIYNVSP